MSEVCFGELVGINHTSVTPHQYLQRVVRVSETHIVLYHTQGIVCHTIYHPRVGVASNSARILHMQAWQAMNGACLFLRHIHRSNFLAGFLRSVAARRQHEKQGRRHNIKTSHISLYQDVIYELNTITKKRQAPRHRFACPFISRLTQPCHQWKHHQWPEPCR